jgi:hypothetical protein
MDWFQRLRFPLTNCSRIVIMDEGRRYTAMSLHGRFCSLIPRLSVKLSTIILARED